MTLRAAILFLLLGLRPLHADERVRVAIDEFSFDNREFNLIVIDNDPRRIKAANDPGTVTDEGPWAEALNALRSYFYARFIQEHLQAELTRNFKEHASLSDTSLDTILGWITQFPHPQRHSRHQGSRPELGEPPPSPLFKIDDLLERESLTILITSKNDLSEIWAAIRIVASDPDRIFWQLRGQPGYHEVQQGTTQYLKSSGRRAYQIEHLSFSRGPYDFFNIGVDAIEASQIFSPATQIYFKTRWRLAPYYLGMNFRPFLDTGSSLFFQMHGEDLVNNARQFSRGIVPNSDLSPQALSQLKWIHAARTQKKSAVMSNRRSVDFQKSFGKLDPFSTLAPTIINHVRTPEFLNLTTAPENCEKTARPRVAFY